MAKTIFKLHLKLYLESIFKKKLSLCFIKEKPVCNLKLLLIIFHIIKYVLKITFMYNVFILNHSPH